MPNDAARPNEPAGGVALRGVRVRAGAATLLDGVDATFPPGCVSVVLGPNGAGKSTLLRVAAGLLRPAAGAVTYGGRPLTDFAPDELARTRAMLAQHTELAFPLTVADVVLMGRYPHFGRSPAAHDRAVVDRALALCELAARRDQPYPTLSGGEAQKTHLARVLAQLWVDGDDAPFGPGLAGPGPADPALGAPPPTGPFRVLFLDEPTASLDVHHQLAVLAAARALAARGAVVAAVLHDLNVALQHADRVLLLDGGRVAHAGDDPRAVPPALLERVFRVRLRPVTDPETGDVVWRATR